MKKLSWIDLKETLKELNHTSGWTWNAIRTADRSKKCLCVEASGEARGQADPNCKRCFGTGYKFTDYIVRSYHWTETYGRDSYASLQVKNAVIQWNHVPKLHDYLLLLDIDPTTGEPLVPYKIARVFKISDYKKLHDQETKLCYWRLYLEELRATKGSSNEIGTGGTGD